MLTGISAELTAVCRLHIVSFNAPILCDISSVRGLVVFGVFGREGSD
jgi:hypothetical protein